jgi:hypothetical protein
MSYEPEQEAPAAERHPVDERKQVYRDAHAGKSIEDLCKAMLECQQKKDELEEQLKEVNAAFDVLRLELIPAECENRGIEGLKIAGIGRLTLTGDMYVRPVADQQGEFFKWLRKNKVGDLIKETIAPSTLKAFVKSRLKQGKPVPDEFVKTTPFTRASITKAR